MVSETQKENRKDNYITDEQIKRDTYITMLMGNFKYINPTLNIHSKEYMEYEGILREYSTLKLKNMVVINF